MLRKIAVGLGALLVGISTAHAELRICNDTRVVQSVAIGYKGDEDWVSKGWWNIDPGACAVVVSGELTQRYYYYFADSKEGGFRGQNFNFCVQDAAFEISGDTDCAQRGLNTQGFREIDTGETARHFSLTLVASAKSAGNGAKAPGGGGETGGGLGTQEVTAAPVVERPKVDTADLDSGLPAGRHGNPFSTAAVFQGCELEDARAYCGFHADGVKLRAYFGGPTPDDLLFALEDLPVATWVELDGDMVEKTGDERAVIFRRVKIRNDADPFRDVRLTLQGDWRTEGFQNSLVSVRGSEVYIRLDGAFSTVRFLRIAARCEGLRGPGPVLLQTERGASQSKCYKIKSTKPVLELVPVEGGASLRFQRM